MMTPALDQGLAVKLPPEQQAPPLAGGPPTPAPPAVAADPAASIQSGGLIKGALQQAIGLMNSARAATAADPNTAGLTAAMEEDQAAKDAAAANIAANMEKIRALQAQDIERPAVPKTIPLPEAPVPEKKDPMRVFGQLIPMIAALGALTTREPAVNALNAATAMLNAAKKNDKEEEATQRQAWIDNLNLAVKNNEQLLGEYNLAINDYKLSVAERMAKVQAIAAENQDQLTLASLKSGKMQSLTNLIRVNTDATGQLAKIALDLTESQMQEKRLAQQQALQWAQLEIERRRAGNISMGDAIGPILLKIQGAKPEQMAQGLTAVLSPGEIAALGTYMDINANKPLGNNPGIGSGGYATGGLGGASIPGFPGATAPPAPAPAAPAPPPPPAAAATPAPTAPMGGMKAPPPAPQNPADRKVGQVYSTPQGPLKWMGGGWARL